MVDKTEEKPVDLSTAYKANEKLELEGIWYKPAQAPGCRFLLAFAGHTNRQLVKVMARLTKPYAKLIANNMVDPDILNDLMVQAFSESVILNWENIQFEGAELSYSRDNCIKLMKALPHLFKELQEVAQTEYLYRANTTEALAKN